MKKILVFLAASLLFSSVSVFAAGELIITPISNIVVSKPKIDKRPVLMREFFTEFCNHVGYGVPTVAGQIPLRIPSVEKTDALYSALQKCVYLGFIANSSVHYQWDSPITPRFVNIFVSKYLKIDPDVNEDDDVIIREDLKYLINSLPNYKMLMALGEISSRGANGAYRSPMIRAQWFTILSQIYQLLQSDYRDGAKVTDDVLIEGAIKGVVDAVNDVNTQYFPPTEAQQFNDQLNGNFEWIGWYLDMIRPGELIITSVLKDSPAQRAWLQANDRIVKVDDYVVLESDSLQAIVAKIKWPAGSVVKLTISRNGSQQVISVTRAKIEISLIDYSMSRGIPIISIHTFGWGVADSWNSLIEQHEATIKQSGKLIIDLRNNPGGSLQDVAQMLGDFVPKWEPVVFTTSRYYDEAITSEWRDRIDFSKIKIVILINGSSASASEIMAGTIKDYLPNNTVLIWERSFGKGSVQYLQSLADNSSFKLTIAHWYTGKSRNAIDGIGIAPDVNIVLDLDQLKQWYDNQLEAALRQ